MSYDYPVYIVVPIGDANENADDADVDTLITLIERTGVVCHGVTDRGVCDNVTDHLVERLTR